MLRLSVQSDSARRVAIHGLDGLFRAKLPTGTVNAVNRTRRSARGVRSYRGTRTGDDGNAGENTRRVRLTGDKERR